MKIAYFDDYQLGIVSGDAIVDVSDAVQDIPHTGPHDLITGLIERFEAYRGKLEVAAASGEALPLSKVVLRAPLPRPFNIDCMAVNYMENGKRSEPAPINGFAKSPNGIIGPGEDMVMPDVPLSSFEAEAELGLVMSKSASNVPASEWRDYVFGYVAFLDGSARGLPPAGNTFYQMKSRETFAPVGPWIVTADEIDDPQNLQITLRCNGEVRQDFNTSDMSQKIPRCVEWVSSLHSLNPGDIIATGTNHGGLSSFMDGDQIELEIEKVGTLKVGVKDDLKRKWPSVTREGGGDWRKPSKQISGKYAPKD